MVSLKGTGKAASGGMSRVTRSFSLFDILSVPVVWIVANFYLQYLLPIFLGTVAVTLVSHIVVHWRRIAYYPYRVGFSILSWIILWFVWVGLDIFRTLPNLAGGTILGFYVAFYFIITYSLGNGKKRTPVWK